MHKIGKLSLFNTTVRELGQYMHTERSSRVKFDLTDEKETLLFRVEMRLTYSTHSGIYGPPIVTSDVTVTVSDALPDCLSELRHLRDVDEKLTDDGNNRSSRFINLTRGIRFNLMYEAPIPKDDFGAIALVLSIIHKHYPIDLSDVYKEMKKFWPDFVPREEKQ